MDAIFNAATALLVAFNVLTTICFELHIALPACVRPFYPCESLLSPLKSYIDWTGDCFVSKPPIWLRVNCGIMLLMLPGMLAALPAIAKGNKPWLRIPLLLASSCMTLIEFQVFMHYLMASGECKGPSMNPTPALAYHGIRLVCWKLVAARLTFDSAYGKRQPKKTEPATSANRRVTRSRAAAKKAS